MHKTSGTQNLLLLKVKRNGDLCSSTNVVKYG